MNASDAAPKRSWRSALDVAVAIALIGASAVFVWAVLSMRADVREQREQLELREQAVVRSPRPTVKKRSLPSSPIPLKSAALRGSPEASVGVIEYSDFECPFCGTFARKTLPAILQSYVDTGKVQFAFRHMPLEARHPRSFTAAEAAECSQRQGKFWQMHDAFFAEPMSLETTSLFGKAHAAGLDSARFRQCMNGEATAKVRQDIAEARSFGITGTPTFLFGTIERHGGLRVVRRESGTLPFEVFAQILDELLEPNGTRLP
jgi:protein-disulfide isomerase